jgi:hypothetical protein
LASKWHPSEFSDRLTRQPAENRRKNRQKNVGKDSAKRGILCLMAAPVSHPRDPLHGITLENILNQLVHRHGWDEMGRRINIRCFQFNPTVKSSLTFLRKNSLGAEAGGGLVHLRIVAEITPPMANSKRIPTTGGPELRQTPFAALSSENLPLALGKPPTADMAKPGRQRNRPGRIGGAWTSSG